MVKPTQYDLISAGDNEDLSKERRAATFSVGRMAAFVHGGEEKLMRRDEIVEFVESRPEFRDPVPVEFMDREQRADNAARKAVAMTDNSDAIDGSDYFGEGMFYQSLIMGRDLHALSLHYVMFLPTLQGQADDEQLEHWLALGLARGVVGTYAQTELGHGTNLSRLETTATYDPSTQEFVIHSPSITAAKWWPGALGKSSNVAVVVAQLYTKGKCHGPHPFIVQLRDQQTHRPLKGIRVGDIGPKFGINGSDNGFLLFDQCRIPRNHMLMRYAKSMQLGCAATIAVRYSAIRRQGEIHANNGEVQILDYQTQQFRLFPQIARTYAFLFAAQQIRDLYMKVTEQLTTGNTELLPEIHALSSGLKAIVSWEVAQGIEQCRLACGGHGYSQASGFPELYTYAVGGCTYEGENIVMLLQVARFLTKTANQVRAGNAQLAEIADYIARGDSGHSQFSSWDKATDAQIITDFEHAARRQVFAAVDLLGSLRATGMSAEVAWNKASVELCKASRLHVKLYLVKTFFATIAECTDPASLQALKVLGRLYALESITASIGAFTHGGYMNDAQARAVSLGVYALLDLVRPNAVALVDSLDFPDRELHSVLGRRDGNVYPALLDWAQKSPLNREEVLPAFQKYLGPMMREGRSKI